MLVHRGAQVAWAGVAIAQPAGRTLEAAVADLRRGWGQRALWGHLGWQDIRQRCRRSVLGPIWITISMAVTAVALGILYAGLFGNDLSVQLPYIPSGSSSGPSSAGASPRGGGVHRERGADQAPPSPLSVHVYRLIWRQTLFFLHNLIVYVVMLLVFPQSLSWASLTAVPAFLLLMVNGAWVALFVGIVTTRFRDIMPITQSVVQLMFFLTPIVWIYDDLLNSPNPQIAERAASRSSIPFCTSSRSSDVPSWVRTSW